jgi:aspartate/methionine/tyrosine aminotransferase
VKLPPFHLERYFARWEFHAPYLLCASDLDGYRLDELLALADAETRALWQDLTLGYTEAGGHPLLRAEIASLYSGMGPDDVLLFSGAEEAIFAFASTALGPGDHAVVVWPAYQSLYDVPRAAGAEVTLLPLRHEDDWRLDVAALRAAVRPNTRAIVVNSPHNPTGAHLDRATFDAVVALAQEAGATLFSDEVYRFLEHDPADRLPAAAEADPRAVSLGVMSKAFALAGLRIGWIATRDAALRAKLASVKDYTTICASAPSEVLALIALRARQAVLARSHSIIGANLPEVDRFLERWSHRLEWVRPFAGCIGFPRLLGDEPVDAFADRLARAEGVLLLPGSAFELAPGDGNHFRLGFGRRNCPEALERLDRFLSRA